MPSPAMVVALIALVVALSGTGIAAVNYARNAGAVDGKSAVSSRSTVNRAAGRLVATPPAGPSKGRIPSRFVSGVMKGSSMSLTQYIKVVDNQLGPVVPLAILPQIGRLDAQCHDQDPAPGVKSTRTVVTFTGAAPGGVNVSRLLGRDIEAGRDGVVFTALKDQKIPILAYADSLFQLWLQAGDHTLFISGAGRSDQNFTNNAACLIFGIGLRVG